MLSPEEVAKQKQELAERKEIRKRHRRRKMIGTILLCFLGVFLLVSSAYFSYQRGLNQRQTPLRTSQDPTMSQVTPVDSRTHILFLGADEKGDSSARTDTILLIAIDPSTGSAGIISIPRDTRVYIPERDSWERINAVHAHGGPKLAVKTVSEFLDVEIDYYLYLDFSGFSQIVDTLGGVEIDVEKDMVYTDTAQDLYIDLKAGLQVLDGDKALEYVRYRDHLGDISLVNPQYEVYGGRVERQRKFIMAVIDEVLRPSTILKLPRLLGQVWSAVDTDIPWITALKLAFAADRFTTDKIETAIVPGTSEVLNGAWYWIADSDRTVDVVNWIINGVPLPLTAEVLNGSGIQGIAATASGILEDDNLEVIRVGNAERYDYPVSEIIVSSKALADRVISYANLIGAEILIDPLRDQPVDVTIIIGRNFNRQ